MTTGSLHSADIGAESTTVQVTLQSPIGVSTYVRRSEIAAGAFGFVMVASLGLMNGGYFPTSWGWGALASLWIAGVVFVLSERLGLGRYDVALLGGLGAFVLFTGASWWWSESSPAAARELERGILTFAGVLAAILLARRRARPLLGGVAAAIAVTTSYGLATRLFPAQLGSFDPIAGYRLADPLGYWNALGIFAAIGTLLALGFAARGQTVASRALGSGAPVLLIPVLYFTFGRGPWLALGIGLVVAVVVDRRRLQFISAALLLMPFFGAAVWLCTRAPALNRRAATLTSAVSEGRHLALLLLALAAGAMAAGVMIQFAERRVVASRQLRRAYVGALVILLLIGIGAVFARYGSPQNIASRSYRAFKAQPVKVQAGDNISQRLFSLSADGRLPQWRVAIDDYAAHPWLGSGAGTYELSWLKDRPGSGKVRNAHSLYLEVLAELGPIGLVLLLFALAVPVFAAIKVRRQALVPVALGAYVAYLVHAGVDWDWEMPAVTIAALLCGVAILVTARNAEGRSLSRLMRFGAVAVVIALAASAFVALMGNMALAASNNAADQLNWTKSAREAHSAMKWAPWSSDPWRQLAEAQYAQGHFPAAQANFRKAIAKDPNNWLLWAELGVASEGTARRAAIEQALRLNPLAPELADYRKDYGK
jgi:O-antigen ligase